MKNKLFLTLSCLFIFSNNFSQNLTPKRTISLGKKCTILTLSCIRENENETLLAAGVDQKDDQLTLWDLNTLKKIKIDYKPLVKNMVIATFSYDAKKIALGEYNGQIAVVDLEKKQNTTIDEPDKTSFYSLPSSIAFNHKGNMLAIASRLAKKAKLWKLDLDKDSVSLRKAPQESPSLMSINCLAWSSSDNKLLIVRRNNKRKHCIYDFNTNSKTFITKTLKHADFSPDGLALVGCDWNNTVYIIDAQTGELLTTFNTPNKNICCLRFSSCGKSVFIAFSNGDILEYSLDEIRQQELKKVCKI